MTIIVDSAGLKIEQVEVSFFDKVRRACVFDRRTIVPAIGFLSAGIITISTASMLALDCLHQMGSEYANLESAEFKSLLGTGKIEIIVLESGMIGSVIGAFGGAVTYFITDLIFS